MATLLINPYSFGTSAPSPYSPEATAFFARMDVQPDDEIKEAIDTFFISMASILAKMDRCYIFALNTSHNSLLDLTNHQDATTVGTVDFVPYAGFNGNGTNFAIATGFRPDGSSNFQQDYNSLGAVVQSFLGNTTNGVTRQLVGYSRSSTNARSFINIQGASTNQINYRANDTSAQTTTKTPMATGHYTLTRPTTNSRIIYYNGAVMRSNTGSGTTLSSWNFAQFYFYASGEDTGTAEGTPTGFAPIRESMGWIGGGLTAEEISDFYYARNLLLSVLGAEAYDPPPEAQARVSISPLLLNEDAEVTYTITLQDGTFPGSIDIDFEGDLGDPDFDASFTSALETAADAATGVTFDGISTLTFDGTFSGALSWSRTMISTVADGDVHAVRLSNSTAAKLWRPYAAVLTGSPVPVTTDKLFGWNNSGYEFSSLTLPPSDWTFDFAHDKGFNCFRFPYRMNRMQPDLYGAINGADAAGYKADVLAIIANGDYVIIDPHDYGGRNIGGVTYKVGSDEFPIESYIDHLVQFLAFLGNHPNIIICLMNEPNGLPMGRWWGAAQSAVDALRASGFYGPIHVPGASHSTASQWVSSGNATYAAAFTDPLDNFAFDVHQYFDSANSGVSGVCATGTDTRLDAVTTWATTNSKKLFLGEFAVGDPAVGGQEECDDVFAGAIETLATNACWDGATGWGYGDRWNTLYHFRALQVNPDTDPDKAFMNLMEDAIVDILGA